MWEEKQIRARMGLADPARAVAVPPAAVSATELITRAEAEVVGPVARRPLLPRRRLLAAAAAGFVVAAVAAYGLVQPARDRPAEQSAGAVVVPIAYEITDDPPPAAGYLRDLAARITDAPYDGQTGEYAYHRFRLWGYTRAGSVGGHTASYVAELERWVAAGGIGRERYTDMGVEFSDEESRRYFEAHPQPGMFDSPWTDVHSYSQEDELAAFDYLAPGEPIPTDPEQRLDQVIGVDSGGAPHFGGITLLYQQHLVPREHRAAVLEVLAEVPGVVWRGEVTDRAGRGGVAVTYDGAGDGGVVVQHVLVFDPQTGELLSRERVNYEPQGPAEVALVGRYALFLESGWTDDSGPEPTEPTAGPVLILPTVEPTPHPTATP
jgi:hypothetical protein